MKVRMHIAGAEFLKAKKTDKELERVIHNLLGKDYTVELFEQVSKQELERIKKEREDIQNRLTSEIKNTNYDKEVENTIEAAIENSDPSYIPPIDDDIININKEAKVENGIDKNINDIEPSIDINSDEIIMGKPTKGKENIIKIKDIEQSSSKVTIDARVINVDIRETKTGKGMLIIEVFDGTASITVKSFSKDLAEGENIKKQIEDAKIIKITGKAGLDTFANDVTIIGNIIIKSNSDIPELPEEDDSTPLIFGKNMTIKEEIITVQELNSEEGNIALEGKVIDSEERVLKSGKSLFTFDLYDGTSTITCKAFLEKKDAARVIKRIKKSKAIRIAGTAGLDTYSDEMSVIVNTIVEIEEVNNKEKRMDNSKEKRVELHMHTKMSQMDAMNTAHDLIKRAMDWNMNAIAITDHGVVQSFPDAHHLIGYNNPKMKVIYGVEGYLAPDNKKIVTNSKNQDIDCIYSVLDLETTGFSAKTEKVTEIGIMKYQNGEVIDEFSCFVNPQKHIPERVTEVTNITDDMVKDARTIEEVFPEVLEFIKDTVVVAHNADFDMGFIKQIAINQDIKLDITYLDTLSLAKALFPELKRFKLRKNSR